MFALVDCNNFFVSCERVFRPDLWNKPVAVLSNNDGCIVARSNEVKALGVPMGAPEFKWRDVLQKNDVTLFSANFGLYGDFSRRVVDILRRETPHIEVYSVDESFLEVTSLLRAELQTWGIELKTKVLQWTGIPVSIGIAPSKTLAKAASEYAKKHTESNGVVQAFADNEFTKRMLAHLDVEDVWGVGRRTAPKLRQYGIRTAANLVGVSPKWARQNFTIRGERTVRELNGEACYSLSSGTTDDGQKSIAVTRSFASAMRAQHQLEPAIASFAAKAAERLRSKEQVAGAAAVYVRTGVHATQQYNQSTVYTFDHPTADTSMIVAGCIEALARVYHPDFAIKKAGVILLDLRPASAQQTTLSQTGKELELGRRDSLMDALDAINTRYGTHMLRTATQGNMKSISDKSLHERRSPNYVSSWEQIRSVG